MASKDSYQINQKRYVLSVVLTLLTVLVKRNEVAATPIHCYESNARKTLFNRCRKFLEAKTYLKRKGFVTAWGSSQNGLYFTDRKGAIDHFMFRGGEASITKDEDDDEIAEGEDYDVEVEEEEYEDEDDDNQEDFVADLSNDFENTIQSTSTEEYDLPLMPSPFTNLFASIGVMILARKFDLFHPIMVKIARFSYILYMISLQVFLLFVRIKAKSKNDRTPLQIANPIAKILQNQSGGNTSGDVGGNMLKSLASSFLSSASTAVEYDLKQAEQMQRGLIFNMLFMWVLHFKMEQVQPLFINTITGVSNLVYSPLFQIYAMGRNLERPFKNLDKDRADGSSSDESDDDVSNETSEDSSEDSPSSSDEDDEKFDS